MYTCLGLLGNTLELLFMLQDISGDAVAAPEGNVTVPSPPPPPPTDKLTFMDAAKRLNVLVFVSGPLQEVSTRVVLTWGFAREIDCQS